MAEDGTVSGSVVLGAVRAALLDAETLTLRSYAVVGVLAAAFTTVLVALALPYWIVQSAGTGVADRAARVLLGVGGLGVVAVMVLPLVFVARRRREGRPPRELGFGLAGYAYLCSLYLALVVSAPAEFRSDPDSELAPLVEALYALPAATGLGFPLAGVLLVLGLEYGLDR